MHHLTLCTGIRKMLHYVLGSSSGSVILFFHFPFFFFSCSINISEKSNAFSIMMCLATEVTAH